MVVQPRTDRPVAIIGAGSSGRRVGCVFVAAGYNVHIIDTSSDALQDAVAYIDAHKEQFTLMPRISKEHEPVGGPHGFTETQKSISKIDLESDTHAPFGHYKTFSDMGPGLSNAWIIIDCVTEKLDLKIRVFTEADGLCTADCIFASTSSSFKSGMLVAGVSEERKKRALNMHFTLPPDIRTVELMTCGETQREVLTYLEDVLGECGMLPVTARRESTGYVNYLSAPDNG